MGLGLGFLVWVWAKSRCEPWSSFGSGPSLGVSLGLGLVFGQGVSLSLDLGLVLGLGMSLNLVLSLGLD